MPLDLDQILRLHDKAYDRGMVTRERASDDLVFYWVTQWDDNLLGESQLQFRGEFNILRKAGRDITSNLNSNPVTVDFEPVDGTDDSGADIIDGMYRADMRNNMSQEAKDNATGEAIVCGVGAWELRNEYKSNNGSNNEQVIRRYPVYEANNNLFWDPNARLLDKSDAKYCSLLEKYSEDGFKEEYKRLTGRDYEGAISSFKYPEESYVFPWLGGEDEKYYIGRFYHVERVKVTTIVFQDMFGETLDLESDEALAREDELIDNGYSIISQKTVEKNIVTLYIVTGESIIEQTRVPGQHIPVIPQYGERAYIEGEEHYEGVTRLAKDPQRLRNFQLSYLADIVARSPREKPIFFPEQIQGFEFMYEENGAENNFPYLLQNRFDGNRNELPIGPPGVLPQQPIPDALVMSIQESRVAVEDVANSAAPKDITDVDLSGKAIAQLQGQFDMQSYAYQKNHKTAMRRDGEVYASMVSDIYDTPREVTLVSADDSSKKAIVMEESFNPETFEREIKNDLRNAVFEVFASVGPAFQTVKAQTKEELKELINGMDPNDPMRQIFLLQYVTMIDGINFEDARNYARRELILMGVKQPESDEEKQMLKQHQDQQAQQATEPDAAMVLAQAEDKKAMADIMKAENDRIDLNIKAEKARQGQDEVSIKAGKLVADTQRSAAAAVKDLATAEDIANRGIRDQIKDLAELTQPVQAAQP